MSVTALPNGVEAKLGGHLVQAGATFRVWAPNAQEVLLIWGDQDRTRKPGPEWRLIEEGDNFVGFVSGAVDGDQYRYWIVGADDQGPKRDPHARELEWRGYPDTDCILRDPASFPWASTNYQRPAPEAFILYQVHVGTFHYKDMAGNDLRRHKVARFLDVLDRFEHIVSLNVTGVQLMPIIEWQTSRSLGYNGTDIYSPEMDHFVPADELPRYVQRVNELRATHGAPPLPASILESGVNQLKAVIDLFHLRGIGVFFDVVYNHAGGGFDDQSIYRFDHTSTFERPHGPYFQNNGWAGGLVFDYQSTAVRDFLVENAKVMIDEFRIDGIRYDEVTVIDNHGGWAFCQQLTNALSNAAPEVMNVAEYWRNDKSWVIRNTDAGGAGFDAVWMDTLRDAIRGAIAAAARGRHAWVNMSGIRTALWPTFGEDDFWRTVHYIENHDLHKAGHPDRQPRIAKLADALDSRSWYARSRSRVASGLLLTAPGIPMIFMGQEFLEDKYWSDNPSHFTNTLIWWDGLDQQEEMRQHLLFTQDLLNLRRKLPALTGRYAVPFQVHNRDRILAMLRGTGDGADDVVVVASLNEGKLTNYPVGFPHGGTWFESLNGDAYEPDPNHVMRGNGESIEANGPPIHSMATSAAITIPPNGFLVFSRKRP